MNVLNEKLGLTGKGHTDILVAKCELGLQPILLTEKGFMPAYHLNKEHWIFVLLNGSAEEM